MALGMYAASVPVYQRQLGALAKVLEKGSAWAAARKVDEAVLGATRLIPDMLPLIRQVHLACRFAEESTARLAGVEVPKAHDNAEKTLAELQPRIASRAGLHQGIQARAAGRQRRPRDRALDRRQYAEIHRGAVSGAFRHGELLFPLHHRLRNLAPIRRGNRETGLPRRPLEGCA